MPERNSGSQKIQGKNLNTPEKSWKLESGRQKKFKRTKKKSCKLKIGKKTSWKIKEG